MKYISSRTSIVDSYRAGISIGEDLQAISPDVIILFCTRGYIDTLPELIEGLREVVGPKTLICGGTGDGIYETAGVAHNGVCALGICVEGPVRVNAVLLKGVQKDSSGVAQAAARKALEGLGEPATLAFVLADGCKTDGSQLVAGLNQVLTVPFWGGLTADGRQAERTVVFLNDEVAEDAVMVLVAAGAVPFSLNASSGWSPIGDLGRVTRSAGKFLYEINGSPAVEFFKDQMGKNIGSMDLGVVALAEYVDAAKERFVLRAISYTDEKAGQVKLFGGLPEGSFVRVCRTSMDSILSGVKHAVAGAIKSGIKPGALVIISCAGRKWILMESGAEELREVLSELGNIPIIGIPSFGEIAPFILKDGTYSKVFFHNVTFVVGILGE